MTNYRVLLRKVLILFLLMTGAFLAEVNAQDTSPKQFLQQALSMQKQAEYEKSSALLHKALPGFNSAEQWSEVADCYNELSYNARFLNQLDKAEQFARKVLELKKSHDSIADFEIISAYLNLGTTETERGNFTEALDLLNQGLAITRKKSSYAPITANLFANIGSVYHELGKFDQAMVQYRKGLNTLDEKNPAHQKQLAILYNHLGVNYVSTGEYDKALAFYQKELKVNKALYGNGHPDVAGVYNNLGSLSYRSGDVGKAINYFQQAAQSFEQAFGQEHPTLAMTYNNLGASYFQMGDLQQSIKYLEKSAAIKEKVRGPNHPDLAVSYNNIGSLYLDLGEYDKAKDYLLRSLSIRKKALGENHPKLTNTYSSLGNLLLQQQKPDSAISYFEREIAITRKQRGPNHPYVADALNNIARSYADQGFYDRALMYHQEALQVLSYHFKDNNYSGNPEVSNIRYPNYAVNVLYAKSKTLQQYYKDDQNLEYLRAGISTFTQLSDLLDFMQAGFQNEQSKLLMSRESHGMYEHGIQIAFELYQKTQNPEFLNQAFYFAEKSKTRVIQELIKNQKAKKFTGIPDSLISYENALRDRMTQLNQQLNRTIDSSKETAQTHQLRDSLFTLNQSLNKHLRFIEKKYPRYHKLKYSQQIPKVSTIQQKLRNQNITLVEYFHGSDSSWAFVLDGNKLMVTSLPHDVSLKEKVSRFRTAITQQTDSVYLAQGSKLYNKLLKPVAHQIQHENILFIPDGALNLLPFEALLTKRADLAQDDISFSTLPYLINDFTISYSPSVSLSTLFRKNENHHYSKNFAAFAPGFNFSKSSIKTRTVDSGDRWTPLPFSNQEVHQIAELFEGKSSLWNMVFGDSPEPKLFLREAATEKMFKTGKMSQYKHLHLATHAFASDTGAHRSGIVFYQNLDDEEDDILFSEEIYNLNLPTKLLVLSACETGTGKIIEGEGIIGFSRAFYYAGVQNLMVSLWRVDDRSTARLMIDFYKNHLEGNSFARSLRTAKQNLINHPVYSHPQYWAPFIFLGQ